MLSLSPATPGTSEHMMDDEIDSGARLARLGQHVDHLGIGGRVELGDDVPVGAEDQLVVDEVDQARRDIVWVREQRPDLHRPLTGEVVEQLETSALTLGTACRNPTSSYSRAVWEL